MSICHVMCVSGIVIRASQVLYFLPLINMSVLLLPRGVTVSIDKLLSSQSVFVLVLVLILVLIIIIILILILNSYYRLI